MNARRYNDMMIGLIETAKEKVCVLGNEDAEPYVAKTREMMEDLQCFWNADEQLTKGDWTEVLDEELEKVCKEEAGYENDF